MTIMTLAELKKHLPGVSLEDEALQRLLEANEFSIESLVGLVANETVIRFPRDFESIIFLGRKPTAIVSIKEAFGYDDQLTLAVDDYTLSGTTLRRVETGTNPRAYWTRPVEIVYSWADDSVDRVRVLVGLVKLDVNHNPGLKSFTVGQHREEYGSGGGKGEPSYEEKRAELLGSLQTSAAVPFA